MRTNFLEGQSHSILIKLFTALYFLVFLFDRWTRGWIATKLDASEKREIWALWASLTFSFVCVEKYRGCEQSNMAVVLLCREEEGVTIVKQNSNSAIRFYSLHQSYTLEMKSIYIYLACLLKMLPKALPTSVCKCAGHIARVACA